VSSPPASTASAATKGCCVVVLALMAAVTMSNDATKTPAQRWERTIAATQDVALLETSPQSLGAAARILEDAFERGVKDIGR